MKIKLLLWTLISTHFFSCVDVFEEDLSDKTMVLNAPSDSTQSINSAVTFWWETLVDATAYNLQVVEPTFSQANALLLDTLISDNQFEFSLYPGAFEWRVAGLNSNSQTAYTTYSLSIDSSLDLTGQAVVLAEPEANFASNSLAQEFYWDAIYSANYYDFSIHRSTAFGALEFSVYETENTQQSYTFSQDGVYYWKVRAVNTVSNTRTPYTSRKIILDTQLPQIPQLLSPANNALLTENTEGLYDFTWTSEISSIESSALEDKLFVSQDSSFLGNPYTIAQGINNLELPLDTGHYFWTVYSIDLAGNQSEAAPFRELTISE